MSTEAIDDSAQPPKKRYEIATLTELGSIADVVEGLIITGGDGLPIYNFS